MIEVGAQAPDFTLPDQDGKEVSLSDFPNRKVLLVFYPADFSPACTDQLNLYQEVLPQLEEAGVQLLGISVDGAFCHRAFREQLGITFPLLADFHPKGEVARSYGVYIESRGHTGRDLVMVGEDRSVAWTHRPESPLEIPGANLIFDALDQQPAA